MVPNAWEELLGSAVKKKVVVQGDGDVPDFGNVVVFNWMGSELVNGIDGMPQAPFGERKQTTARIGDGDEIPGTATYNVVAVCMCFIKFSWMWDSSDKTYLCVLCVALLWEPVACVPVTRVRLLLYVQLHVD